MKDILNKYEKLIKVFFTFFIFFASGDIQIILARILHINIKNITYKTAIPLSCFSTLIITIILIILYRKDLKNDWKKYKSKLSDNIDVAVKYWLIGFFIMIFSNIIINFVFHAGQANNEKIVQKMISYYPILLLFSAGFISPITEEIVFRKTFKDIIKNKLVFIIVSGLLFGYVHVISSTTVSQFLYIIPYSSLGLMFAAAYSKTDTVITPISMHMFHNTAITLLSILI